MRIGVNSATYLYDYVVATPDPVTVSGVTVSPSTTTVQKGETETFTAIVTGTGAFDSTVIWSVDGAEKSGTDIGSTGLLTVADDETAATLTVTATSNEDGSKIGTATVTVTDVPVTKYTLTVVNGSGSDEYAENAIVTITADAPAGKEFDKWTTTDGVTFVNANAASTSFTMPANAVTVTATYKDLPDTTLPTGEIKVGTHGWNNFWNTVTFGLLCKNTQSVTIAGEDNSGGDVTVQYYLSSTELTAAEAAGISDWQSYTGSFTINPNNKYIVYAKLTDPSGNSTVVNSAGIVVYTDSVGITAALNHVKGSGTKIAEVTLNGNTIAKIMNGTATLLSGTDYTVSGGTITLTAAYMDGLPAGNYMLTVHYNPLGIAYPDSPLSGSEVPATTSFALTVSDAPITTYIVTLQNDDNGTGSASPATAEAGTEITLSATPNSGYVFKEWEVVSGGVTITGNKFTMPANDVTIKAHFEATSEPTYSVTVQDDGNGTGSASPTSAEAGTEITLSAAANYGYQFKEWRVVVGGVTVSSNKFTMPANDVTVKAIFEETSEPTYSVTPATYTVTIQNDGNGTGSASPTTAEAGTEITLSATPNSGYVFKEWEVVSGGVTITGNKFTMPANDVTIKAHFEATSEPTYSVTVQDDGNGTGSASPTSAEAGTEITLSATPDSGYKFKEWQVVSGGVTVSSNKFTMPTSDVTVKGIFEKIPDETPVYKITDGADGSWKKGTEADVSVTCDGDFDNFTGVKVDGTLISADSYTAVSGSTVITLKAAYLETLSVGEHTVELVYGDGSALTKLTVLAKDAATDPSNPGTTDPSETSKPDSRNPNTGDSSSFLLLYALLLLSGAGLLGTAQYGKKRRTAK